MPEINTTDKSQWSKNLIFLRLQKGESQTQTATVLGLSRSTYSNYEADENLPNIDTIRKILGHFSISFEDFLLENLENVRNEEKNQQKKKPQNVRDDVRNRVRERIKTDPKSYYTFLETHYNRSDLHRVYELTNNAVADILFLISHQDQLGDLESPLMTGLSEGLHIQYQMREDSMWPTIKIGDKIIATYQPEPATTLREGQIYLIADKVDGIICKRIDKVTEDRYKLESDNEMYKPYVRASSDFIAVFKVVEVHTRNLLDQNTHLRRDILRLREEIFKKMNKDDQDR